MNSTSRYHSIPTHNISFRHFIKHFPSSLQPPTFHRKINQPSTNINIPIKTTRFHIHMNL
ncbi:hypothetical protein Leryth_020781 [Lithospermum erythrorhizon]|nr:hypothetical protein Leryth_020781 [Lithospermum erythrorhizon]